MEIPKFTKEASDLIKKLRVIINEKGESTTLELAVEKHNIIPNIIFIRNDGFALGAPESFKRAAYKINPYNWKYYYMTDTSELRPISEYNN